MTRIPETHRRKALYSALYQHDGVETYAGGSTDGDTITVIFRGETHPVYDEPGKPVGADSTREYVKRMATALGFAYSSKGRFEADLRPDEEHALASIRSR